MSNAAQMPVEMKTRLITGFPAPANLYARFKSDVPNDEPVYDRVEALVVKELTWLGDTYRAHRLDGFVDGELVGEVSSFDGFEFRGPDNPESAAVAAALAEGFAKIEKAIMQLAEVLESKPKTSLADADKKRADNYQIKRRLVEWALSFQRRRLERTSLSADELMLLESLEERRTALEAQGFRGSNLQDKLEEHAIDWPGDLSRDRGRAA